MFKPLAVCVVASMLVAFVSATCFTCPQVLPGDTSPPFCASNRFGQRTVTQSEFASWNCNNRLNKYTVVSQTACPAAPADTCSTNECGTAGPQVCAILNDPSGPFGPKTSAVFANQCQQNYYQCKNPNIRITAGSFFLNPECRILS